MEEEKGDTPAPPPSHAEEHEHRNAQQGPSLMSSPEAPNPLSLSETIATRSDETSLFDRCRSSHAFAWEQRHGGDDHEVSASRPYETIYPGVPLVAACLRVLFGTVEWLFNVKGFILLMIVPYDTVSATVTSSWTYSMADTYVGYHGDMCCSGKDHSYENWETQELECTNVSAVRDDWRGSALYWAISLMTPIVVQLLMLLWATREAVVRGPGSLRVILNHRRAINGRWFRRLVYFNIALTVAAGIYFSTLEGERKSDIQGAWYLIVLAVIGLRDLLHPWEPTFLDVDIDALGRGDDIHLRSSISVQLSSDYSDQMSTLQDALLSFKVKGDESVLHRVVVGYNNEGTAAVLNRIVIHASDS